MFPFTRRRWLHRHDSSRKVRTGSLQRRPEIEAFEERLVLSPISWIKPDSGNWEIGSNWSGGAVPGASDDVIIDVPGNITVTHGTGFDSVHSLTGKQNLAITNSS